ncbi:hypothetical protein MNBD_GAMMA13-490 [hydrothermal vent metagenome]|uniref:Rhs-family protein n=1 Tax=hydrothermal vent metagenome TaxID=652676 RepID=A0A3B0YES3_9ZZZZ
MSGTSWSGSRRRTALIKSSHYIYDCFNRRVASVIDQAESGSSVATTYFVYAGQAAWQLAEEYPSEESDAVGNSYVYGLYIDEILTMRDHASANDDDYFYHQDDLFSVYAMTDEDGDVVERYEYGDYGQVSVFDEDGADRSVSSYGNRHTYTGRLLDTELTLDDGGQMLQYRHRYMSTGSGRFLQRDPIGYVDGMGLYKFARTNPNTFQDPLGLAACSAAQNPGCTVDNPNKLPTPNECCTAAKKPCGKGAGGGVVCCNGKPAACNWHNPKIPQPGDDILGKCIKEHEKNHFDDIDCGSCPQGEGMQAGVQARQRSSDRRMSCIFCRNLLLAASQEF